MPLPLPESGSQPRRGNPFRINTCKSVSKQMTLSVFRMNTYEKTGGRGALRLTKVIPLNGLYPQRPLEDTILLLTGQLSLSCLLCKSGDAAL